MKAESFARWRIPREIDGIALLGDFEHGPGRSGHENRHVHAELEMHLVTHGQCVFLLGEHRIEADRGTLLWVPPRREHTILDPSPSFRRWMLLTRPRLVRRVLPPDDVQLLLGRGARGQDAPALGRSLDAKATHALVQQFDEASRTGREHFALHNATMGHLLARAFSAYASADGRPTSSILHPAVAAAIRLLRAGDDVGSRADVARRCGISEWHLSKLFHEQVGVSLLDFRSRCRLERFLELYGDGRGVKMTSVALEAGFGSYPQFHRVFRERMGCAPAEHARRLRGA
jgi:AraC-like DNA-binding protein